MNVCGKIEVEYHAEDRAIVSGEALTSLHDYDDAHKRQFARLGELFVIERSESDLPGWYHAHELVR